MGKWTSSINALAIQPYNTIELEELPYKFPMKSPLTVDGELRQLRIGVSQGYPSIQLGKIRDEAICIVGYGPSLHDTWKEITGPCLTVSGAHDFLCERGIIPTYHAECDGRDHKVKHLEKPNKETEYLISTLVNPKIWEQLEGCKVTVWHNAMGKHVVDWIGENDPGTILVAGGSVIGQAAIHLAGILGYRRFKLFGMDGNFRGDDRHAGPHYGPPQRVIERMGWKTTPQMSNAVDEFGWLKRDHPELEFTIYGDSLLKALHGA